MNRDMKIFVAGGAGMVGSAIVRALIGEGYTRIVTSCHTTKPSFDPSWQIDVVSLDLTRQAETEVFFDLHRPDCVFLAAAKVGGIIANSTYMADFIVENLAIALNVIKAAHRSGVKKLLNLGSSCIYPRHAPQPMKEEYLLTGTLEPTNEAYAIAKIAAIKLCRYFNEQYGTNYLSLMPPNLYGPNDNYDPENSHVLAALIRKFYDAKVQGTPHVTVWGTGSPRREFLHVDDLAAAAVFLMERYDYKDIGEFINVGSGTDQTIAELAELVQEITGFAGDLVYDRSKPDGMPMKLLDISRITALGWSPKISLRDGIESTCRWYTEHRT